MPVYLDNSATTAVAPEGLDAMYPFFIEEMGNAESVHRFGQREKSAVENARRRVAGLIGASPAEIVFGSGGTEADNLAITGVARAYAAYGRHIITSAVEHPAVLSTCSSLESEGFEVTYLPVGRAGVVRSEDIRAALKDTTVLISLMYANNETGVVQPIAEAGAIVQEARRTVNPHLYFHTDAVQAAGKINISLSELGVDLLSISAHKIHGPKGIGALYVKKGTRLAKLIHGGHHERDRRAGTENVPAIAGFGKACEIARVSLNEHSARMNFLRDRLESGIAARVEDVGINGDPALRLPNISSMSFGGVDGESLLIALDLKGVAVSTGSACSSGSLEPSHVLTAMGLSREEVRGSIRFSLSSFTTQDEIDYAIQTVSETVEHLRRMTPLESEPHPAATRA